MQKYAGFSPLMKILYRLLPGRVTWSRSSRAKNPQKTAIFSVASSPEAKVTAALRVKNTLKYRRFLGFYIDSVITRQLTGMPLAAEQLWCFSLSPLLFWSQSVEILSLLFSLRAYLVCSSQFRGSCREKYISYSPHVGCLYRSRRQEPWLSLPGMVIFSCHQDFWRLNKCKKINYYFLYL